jgi:hypothetical protein
MSAAEMHTYYRKLTDPEKGFLVPGWKLSQFNDKRIATLLAKVFPTVDGVDSVKFGKLFDHFAQALAGLQLTFPAW